MTSQIQPTTLSAELARSGDDERRRVAQSLNAALHHLALMRACANNTTYEIEWARIFDPRLLVADARRSDAFARAALYVHQWQQHLRSLIRHETGIDEEDLAKGSQRFVIDENDLP